MSPETHIHIHPPTNEKYRALKKSPFINDPRPYLDRNKDIVDASHMLIAIPNSPKEEERSGTWSTIRYAQKKGVPVMLIYPDGSTEWS
jgi:hypothetical protein